jgi:hypothetical protein
MFQSPRKLGFGLQESSTPKVKVRRRHGLNWQRLVVSFLPENDMFKTVKETRPNPPASRSGKRFSKIRQAGDNPPNASSLKPSTSAGLRCGSVALFEVLGFLEIRKGSQAALCHRNRVSPDHRQRLLQPLLSFIVDSVHHLIADVKTSCSRHLVFQ